MYDLQQVQVTPSCQVEPWQDQVVLTLIRYIQCPQMATSTGHHILEAHNSEQLCPSGHY